jgi:hypothetical protein
MGWRYAEELLDVRFRTNKQPAMTRSNLFSLVALSFAAVCCSAQERPYFITYSHDMEEPGNLEITFLNAIGRPAENRFIGFSVEFEYGVKTWWTSAM